jgi:hypothetical protein
MERFVLRMRNVIRKTATSLNVFQNFFLTFLGRCIPAIRQSRQPTGTTAAAGWRFYYNFRMGKNANTGKKHKKDIICRKGLCNSSVRISVSSSWFIAWCSRIYSGIDCHDDSFHYRITAIDILYLFAMRNAPAGQNHSPLSGLSF